jgi:hypothetical protein
LEATVERKIRNPIGQAGKIILVPFNFIKKSSINISNEFSYSNR